MVLLDDDLPEPLPMGQESFKSFERILAQQENLLFLDYHTELFFDPWNGGNNIMALPVQGHPCKSHVLTWPTV